MSTYRYLTVFSATTLVIAGVLGWIALQGWYVLAVLVHILPQWFALQNLSFGAAWFTGLVVTVIQVGCSPSVMRFFPLSRTEAIVIGAVWAVCVGYDIAAATYGVMSTITVPWVSVVAPVAGFIIAVYPETVLMSVVAPWLVSAQHIGQWLSQWVVVTQYLRQWYRQWTQSSIPSIRISHRRKSHREYH